MAHGREDLRWSPDRDLLQRLVTMLVPGGRLHRVTRLKGGISCGTHRLDVLGPAGERRPLVLRRFGDWWKEHDPGVAGREWKVLSWLRGSPVPVAEPLWLDQAGGLFGRPALVTSLLPGRGTLVPRDVEGWIRQLAASLAAIHALPLPDPALDELAQYDQARAERLAGDPPASNLRGHPRAREVWDALRHLWPRVERDGPVLVHGDYWGGNTLWQRGRLTGVVDWEAVGLASRGYDVGYTHMDLSLCLGGSVPDRFVAAYREAAGWTMRDAAFWKLLGAWRALHDWTEWAPGWRAFGLVDLTNETVGARLNAYLEAALRAAERRPWASLTTPAVPGV